MILLPLLAGAGFLGLLLAGGKKPKVLPNGDIEVPLEEKKKAVKKVTEAANKKDWQSAIANALASGSKEVISALAKRLEKEGLKGAAKDLVGAFEEMQKLAKNKSDPRPIPGRDKKSWGPPTKPSSSSAKPAPKPVAKPNAKPAPKTTTQVTIGPATITSDSSAKTRALKMREMLLKSKRYSEDKNQVAAVQKDLKLSADGKYGPGTAKALFTAYKIVPSNPYYWSANNTAATVSAYKNWLASLKSQVSASDAQAIDKMLPTVGK